MVDDFIKNGGYKIKVFETETNPFADIILEETERDDEDENERRIVDMDEEEVIYLDDVDVSDADTEDSGDDADEINDAFVLLD